jgi:hypothetical protein
VRSCSARSRCATQHPQSDTRQTLLLQSGRTAEEARGACQEDCLRLRAWCQRQGSGQDNVCGQHALCGQIDVTCGQRCTAGTVTLLNQLRRGSERVSKDLNERGVR